MAMSERPGQLSWEKVSGVIIRDLNVFNTLQ